MVNLTTMSRGAFLQFLMLLKVRFLRHGGSTVRWGGGRGKRVPRPNIGSASPAGLSLGRLLASRAHLRFTLHLTVCHI